MNMQRIKDKCHFMLTIPTAHENAIMAMLQLAVCLISVSLIYSIAPASSRVGYVAMLILLGYGMLQGIRAIVCLILSQTKAYQERDRAYRAARYLFLVQRELGGEKSPE